MHRRGSIAAQWSALIVTLGWHIIQANGGPLYKVCLVQNPGFANCTVGGNQTTFSGIDVDLINMVGAYSGWVQVWDANANVSHLSVPAYTFVCTSMRVPPVISILTNASSVNMDECALGAGAFTATAVRIQQGARFSWPHVHASLGVMVASDTQQTKYDKWAFLRPFSRNIWITVIMSTVFTPVLLSIFENVIQTGRVPVGMSLLTEWRHATYTMFLCCFNLQVLEVLSAPCQIIIICFAFTNLILVASYTANLAAVLTAAATTTGIQSLKDLIGKNVAAHSVYVDRIMQNKLIKASPLTWAGEPTFLQVKDMILNGNLDAYIFDRPLLQYFMNVIDPNCQLNLLSDSSVEPYDYGIAFHRLVPDEVVRNFSLGVLQAQSLGQLNLLQERYISDSTTCGSSESYDNALQFDQISGLYIILGASLGLGLLGSIYSVWWYHVHKPRKAKKEQAKWAAAAEAAAAEKGDWPGPLEDGPPLDPSYLGHLSHPQATLDGLDLKLVLQEPHQLPDTFPAELSKSRRLSSGWVQAAAAAAAGWEGGEGAGGDARSLVGSQRGSGRRPDGGYGSTGTEGLDVCIPEEYPEQMSSSPDAQQESGTDQQTPATTGSGRSGGPVSVGARWGAALRAQTSGRTAVRRDSQSTSSPTLPGPPDTSLHGAQPAAGAAEGSVLVQLGSLAAWEAEQLAAAEQQLVAGCTQDPPAGERRSPHPRRPSQLMPPADIDLAGTGAVDAPTPQLPPLRMVFAEAGGDTLDNLPSPWAHMHKSGSLSPGRAAAVAAAAVAQAGVGPGSGGMRGPPSGASHSSTCAMTASQQPAGGLNGVAQHPLAPNPAPLSSPHEASTHAAASAKDSKPKGAFAKVTKMASSARKLAGKVFVVEKDEPTQLDPVSAQLAAYARSVQTGVVVPPAPQATPSRPSLVSVTGRTTFIQRHTSGGLTHQASANRPSGSPPTASGNAKPIYQVDPSMGYLGAPAVATAAPPGYPLPPGYHLAQPGGAAASQEDLLRAMSRSSSGPRRDFGSVAQTLMYAQRWSQGMVPAGPAPGAVPNGVQHRSPSVPMASGGLAAAVAQLQRAHSSSQTNGGGVASPTPPTGSVSGRFSAVVAAVNAQNQANGSS